MKELTPYQEWQMEKYGNIVPNIEEIALSDFVENGCEDIDRFREWVLRTEEQELINREN